MRTQAAIRAATISPEQLFGDWTMLQEFEKPLCKVTLSNASAGGESYKVVINGVCDASIMGFAPSTWRLENNELLFSGRAGTWRFAESGRDNLGADSAQHRSAADDAAVTAQASREAVVVGATSSAHWRR